MDSIDKKILGVLHEDATRSIAQIGERVGLSQTPRWKRIQRLESEGLIERRVALLNPEKLGLKITALVSIETSDRSAPWLASFASRISAMPEVLAAYRMTGEWTTYSASSYQTCRPTTPSTNASSRRDRSRTSPHASPWSE
jgi:Lrp/AsnC family transcriptional regulator